MSNASEDTRELLGRDGRFSYLVVVAFGGCSAYVRWLLRSGCGRLGGLKRAGRSLLPGRRSRERTDVSEWEAARAQLSPAKHRKPTGRSSRE
ncbi:hypothetical protein [Haladaptatus sp. NG-SE-30]